MVRLDFLVFFSRVSCVPCVLYALHTVLISVC